MSLKDRLSQLSDFQQKFYKETAGITDKKALQDKYLNESPTVQEGDNIEDVSFANKISAEEFLIANTNFSSKDDLLYPGKVVYPLLLNKLNIDIKDTTTKIAPDELITGVNLTSYETKPAINEKYSLLRDSNGNDILPENYIGIFNNELEEFIYYSDL